MKENENVRLTYIGYSKVMIQCLLVDERFALIGIITNPGILAAALKEEIVSKGIHLYEMDGNEDIHELEKHILTDKVLIYKFGYILPKDIIAKHDFYNIHPGSIETNRGAHPLRWTILLGEKKTWLTLYQITGIDEGNVVCEEEIEVENSDYIELDHKLDVRLPKVLDRYISYVLSDSSERTILKERGLYRRKVKEEDYTIDLVNDTYDVIERKIRAVKDFGGAVILWNQVKYRVREIIEEDETERGEEKLAAITFGKNGRKYVLICEEYVWK